MNKKSLFIVTLTLSLLLISIAYSAYADCGKCSSCAGGNCGTKMNSTMKLQAVCPVMGGKIDKAQYVDYKGKRIYFQDAKSKTEFQKAPEKYMAKLKGVQLENAPKATKAQTICPVMGEKINKKFYADYEGKRVYFCCSACVPEFKKNPGKYMEKLKGVQLEEAPKK